MVKISEFDNIQRVVEVLKNVNHALKRVNRMKNNFGLDNVSDQDDKFDGMLSNDYCCYVFQHFDGSGRVNVELNGCYVGDEISDAIVEVLEQKQQDLKVWLNVRGVNTNE